MNALITDRMYVALDAWGEVPAWVEALVKACDEKGSSQNKVAKRLGYTGSVVSAVIRNRYPAGMEAIEDRVRAIYLPEDVTCPTLGAISSEVCLGWRDQVRAKTGSGPFAVRMRKACPKCPRFHPEGQDD
ncbi:helix-turn-helix transcriptional regulator [Thalassococcus sp. S3]|uniref:helix-turn-helix domain-containing protein n=1 Tax=Thalassococcus sp. S3 TaxID=2017482 RepID=UPI00102439D8|nr:helix-turn-helix transcriptional regulator [Thalassococcus sp. S3]QBF31533.1 hypothetical protein CFI11_09935 [Thalassococcus sp. S3]